MMPLCGARGERLLTAERSSLRSLCVSRSRPLRTQLYGCISGSHTIYIYLIELRAQPAALSGAARRLRARGGGLVVDPRDRRGRGAKCTPHFANRLRTPVPL